MTEALVKLFSPFLELRLISKHWFATSCALRCGLFLSCLLLAQNASLGETFDKTKSTKVTVDLVRTEIIADVIELQGRFVAGSTESVTASLSAKIEVLDLKLGDMVLSGQSIAQQEYDSFELSRMLLRAQLAETRLRNDDISAEIKSEIALIELSKQQVTLLDRKANRAEELVVNNALPLDTAETILSDSLAAQQKLLSQESGLARKKTQLALGEVTQNRLQSQINKLDADIASTTLRSSLDGQIVFLFPDKIGFAREGEVIARILSPSIFEVEVEVPVLQLPFLERSSTVSARTLDDYPLELSPRVIIPVQNARNATRIVRFNLITSPDDLTLAENAVVTVQLPIASPSPVLVVPKDAVIPVAGGHIVYVAEKGKARRRLIRLGTAVKSGFIVRSGLEAGSVVVIRGNEQLSDGKDIDYGADKVSPNKRVDS